MKNIHAGALVAALLIFPTLLSAQTGTGGPDFGGLATSGTGDGRVAEEGDREIILRLMREIDDWQSRLRQASEAKQDAERLAGEKADAIRALGAQVQQRNARSEEIQRTIIPQINRQIGQANEAGRRAAAEEAEARSQAGAWATDADSAAATVRSLEEELETARSEYQRIREQAAAANSSGTGTSGTGGSGTGGSGTGTSGTGSSGTGTSGTGTSGSGTGGSGTGTSGTGGTGTSGTGTSGTGDADWTAALASAENRVRLAERALGEAEDARSEASRQTDIWIRKASAAAGTQRNANLRIASLNGDITRLNAELASIPGLNDRDRIQAEQVEADRQRLLQQAGRSAEDITAAEGELASRQRELAEYHQKYLELVRGEFGDVGGFDGYFGQIEQLGWNRNATPGVPLIYSLRTGQGSLPLDTIEEWVTTDRQSFVDNAQADKERADGQLESLQGDLERLEARAEREQNAVEQSQTRFRAAERELAAAQQQRDDAPSAVTALWGARKKKRAEAIERMENAEANHATVSAQLRSAQQALRGTQGEVRGKRDAISRQDEAAGARDGVLERELRQQELIKQVDDGEARQAIEDTRSLL